MEGEIRTHDPKPYGMSTTLFITVLSQRVFLDYYKHVRCEFGKLRFDTHLCKLGDTPTARYCRLEDISRALLLVNG